MKRTFLALCAFAVVLLSNSCDLGDDGPNFHFVPLRIESVDMPESFDLNETYEINVTFTVPDGCTLYEGIDVTKEEETTRKVVAVGSQRTDQEICTETAREEESSFSFVVLYSEPYLFRFYQGDDVNGDPLFLEIEVPVN